MPLPRSTPRLPTVLLAALLACCLAAACTPQKRATRPTGGPPAAFAPADGLPRVDPGYLQWLEKQSMLGAAPELTAQVSGTERIWRNSSTARRLPVLLGAAPNWLELNPYAVGVAQPLFRALSGGGAFLEMLPRAGFNGLFISPTGERADIWNKRNQSSPGGENVASLHFDPALGADADFEKLALHLERLQIQTGGELPPAHTGLGPDFILQARRAARFDGIYAMIAVPPKDWDILPRLPDEWECLPLRPEAAAQLAVRGLLPEALARDSLPWATPGGWAATGEVRGADGQIRRWVYRYSGDPLRPTLLWQDPSGQARRIFSAAIIRHTGLQRQTLAGLRLEALMGLDVLSGAPEGPSQDAARALLTPGLEALDDAAREVRRYGGWAMQDDVLPPSLTATVLAGAVDFTRDAATPAAAAYALLSGDAAPLAALLRAAQAAGVDQSRLARGLHDWLAVDWRPLLDLPQGRELIRTAQRKAGGPPEALQLWTTPASLAARALGLKPSDAAASSGSASSAEKKAALREACLLLLSWRVGLPGLSFVSPQDMTGALALPRATPELPASLGLTPLWRESAGGSRPPAPLAFGPLERQWADGQSFLHAVSALLRARKNTGLARGRLLAVFSGPPGCAGVLSALPDGGHWLLAANFSAEKQSFSLTLPHGATTGRLCDILNPHAPAPAQNGRALKLDLDARQARHLLLGGQAEDLFPPRQPGATP